MTAPIRTAAVGVGHFGRFHAQKYAKLERAHLVAVCDADVGRADAVAQEVGARAVTDPRDLIGAVDAVSVVVPTRNHYDVARLFLENGVHVLLEKPMTETAEQAAELTALAEANNAVLQVGHLEQFSSVRAAMTEVVTQPLYIEANRIGPFRMRGTDVSIVLDLMIHDIDLILTLVDAPVATVESVGAPVLSREEDIANSRIRFANGCVASITASRISMKNERKMRIFQPSSYVAVDFSARTVLIARKTGDLNALGIPDIQIDERTCDDGDSLENEVAAFLDSVAGGPPPRIGGREGQRALEVALRIREGLAAHRAFVDAHLLHTTQST